LNVAEDYDDNNVFSLNTATGVITVNTAVRLLIVDGCCRAGRLLNAQINVSNRSSIRNYSDYNGNNPQVTLPLPRRYYRNVPAATTIQMQAQITAAESIVGEDNNSTAIALLGII